MGQVVNFPQRPVMIDPEPDDRLPVMGFLLIYVFSFFFGVVMGVIFS